MAPVHTRKGSKAGSFNRTGSNRANRKTSNESKSLFTVLSAEQVEQKRVRGYSYIVSW